MAEVHQFVPARSPVDAITNALNVAEKVYGIQGASAQAKLIAAHANQAQTQFENQQNTMHALQDPESPETKKMQALGGALANMIDPKGTSPLHGALTQGSGYQIQNTIDSSPLLKDIVETHSADLRNEAMANMMKARVEPQVQRLEEQKNQNSIQAGHAFEDDPIIKLSKTSLNSLAKSQSILENPNKPVTTKDLNLAYNDYINSVAAGGAATEGKIQRELPDTYATQLNELKGKFGEFDDLRKDATGKQLIDMLHQNIATVRNDMQKQISDQALNVYSNFQQTSNPKVKQIALDKLRQYAPDKFSLVTGKSASPAAPSAPSVASSPSGTSNSSSISASDASAMSRGMSPANASDDMVSVVSPEGKTGRIPRANLDAAQKRGFKVNASP